MLPSSVKDFRQSRDRRRYRALHRFAGILRRSERVAILKLVWDFIGTEFAGRHEQYEKFYGGASFLVKQNMARTYDFAAATKMVERALPCRRTPDANRDIAKPRPMLDKSAAKLGEE